MFGSVWVRLVGMVNSKMPDWQGLEDDDEVFFPHDYSGAYPLEGDDDDGAEESDN